MHVFPYLLAPTAHSVSIAWEAPAGIVFSVRIRPAGQEEQTVALSPDDNICTPVTQFSSLLGEPDGVYWIDIEELCPDTLYDYFICNGHEIVGSGSLRTPSQSKVSSRYLLMSDSHAFNLREEMAKVTFAGQYDAVFHLGDMPSGTGYQKEQYSRGWFEAFAEPLARIPFIYAPGNHDDGPHFDTYFSHQSHLWNRDSKGRSFSFTDTAGIHFVVVDSNPWGLTEMNAVNSGIPLDDAAQRRIDEIERWLIQDLQSEDAVNAHWRVVLLHHPYTDPLTNRRLCNIVERFAVDLVLSGHLHEYHKAVPIEGKVNPKPVYLTLPSCQDPAEGFQRGSIKGRLMEEFPEMLATGNGNYAELDADQETLQIRIFGFNREGTQHLIDKVILSRELGDDCIRYVAPEFSLHEGIVTVRAIAHNSGTGLGIIRPVVVDNGAPHTIALLGDCEVPGALAYLDPGETHSITFTYSPKTPGSHCLEFAGSEYTIDIAEVDSVTCGNISVELSRDDSLITVTSDLVNQSEKLRLVTLALYWDGVRVSSQDLDISPASCVGLQIPYYFKEGGSHVLSIRLNDVVVYENVYECGGGITVVPRIRDKSLWGNDGLIRGTPRLCAHEGQPSLELVDEGDYIEIPPSPSLQCGQSFSALIRAKMDRLATSEEMAHNPLLVRGLSVGWGATYHLRMVVDRNGTMKWGTCYGPNEYGWAGGNASLKQWANYAFQFGVRDGGISRIDTQTVASVPPVGDSVALNDYSSLPLFVGYSFIGHVIEDIGRPKYFTHFPGSISRVVYADTYTDDLEIATSSDWQASTSPNIRVNLDFGTIETEGIYTSQWRQVRNYKRDFFRDADTWRLDALKVSAQIPPQCRTQVRIEVSNNQKTVDAFYEVYLDDGTKTYNLPTNLQGEFFRIVCTLTGTATLGERIRIPRIDVCTLLCHREGLSGTVTWSTQEDWQAGSFNGAIGIEPMDRLTIFEEYTDPIHG